MEEVLVNLIVEMGHCDGGGVVWRNAGIRWLAGDKQTQIRMTSIFGKVRADWCNSRG